MGEVRVQLKLALVALACCAVIGGALGWRLSVGSASDSAPIRGCTQQPSQELFQSGEYDCPDGTVYIFASKKARDHWTEIATEFGAVILSQGPTWVRVVKH